MAPASAPAIFHHEIRGVIVGFDVIFIVAPATGVLPDAGVSGSTAGNGFHLSAVSTSRVVEFLVKSHANNSFSPFRLACSSNAQIAVATERAVLVTVISVIPAFLRVSFNNSTACGSEAIF